MRTFDYAQLAKRHWDSEMLGLVAQIHEYKGAPGAVPASKACQTGPTGGTGQGAKHRGIQRYRASAQPIRV